MNTNDIKVIREATEYIRDYAKSTSPELLSKYAEDAISALDRLEAQQPRVRYRSQVSGMWYETLEAAGDVDCVEVDGVQFCQENGVKCLTQQQPKRLTDEHYRIIANRMLEEHGKYGDKLRAGHWAEIAARKVVSHLQDFGYIGGLSEEWAYYQLQCEAIYPGVKDAADQMRARLTEKASKP